MTRRLIALGLKFAKEQKKGMTTLIKNILQLLRWRFRIMLQIYQSRRMLRLPATSIEGTGRIERPLK